jgi:outer membrane lipopolysaccharide assembly protein LptE/RlpB
MTKGGVAYFVAVAAVTGVTSCGFSFHDKSRAQMTIDERTRQNAESRERVLIQFTASEKWIVFPIPLDGEMAVLAVINRETRHRMLVFSGRSFLAFPQL